MSPEEKTFDSIGYYSPPEAERLLEDLEKAEIEFRLQPFDGIDPTPRREGRFGQAAKVHILVDAERMDGVNRIQAELFGEILPEEEASHLEEEPPQNAESINPNSSQVPPRPDIPLWQIIIGLLICFICIYSILKIIALFAS